MGPHDYYIDLLFYNYHLHCFVIFELKIGEFKPEYAGKLNFYIHLVNDKLRLPDHKPTIGVLLCKTPDETVVKYSLSGIGTPMGVSEYKLASALPRTLKGGMPTISEIEAELAKEQTLMDGNRIQQQKAKKQLLPTAIKTGSKKADAPAKKHPLLNKVFLPLVVAMEAGLKRSLPRRAGEPGFTFRTANKTWKNVESFQKYMNNDTRTKESYDLGVQVKTSGKKISAGCRLIVKTHLSGFTAGIEGKRKPLISKKQIKNLSRRESDRIIQEVVNYLGLKPMTLRKKTVN